MPGRKAAHDAPTSLYAVDRAAEVAQAAQAKLVVVAAYNGSGPRKTSAGLPLGSITRSMVPRLAAGLLEKSLTGLTKQRVRYVDQRLVPGDPAQALLDTVGPNTADLIVVSNRGLGAADGQLLGSDPGNVVRNALCDVLIVQTSGAGRGPRHG